MSKVSLKDTISESLFCISLIIAFPQNVTCFFVLQCFDTVGWAAGRASGL